MFCRADVHSASASPLRSSSASMHWYSSLFASRKSLAVPACTCDRSFAGGCGLVAARQRAAAVAAKDRGRHCQKLLGHPRIVIADALATVASSASARTAGLMLEEQWLRSSLKWALSLSPCALRTRSGSASKDVASALVASARGKP